MRRMNIHPKLVRVIESLYRKPTFKVEAEGRESLLHEQQTGIRQGCPLSPYLFLIVMTAMFHDVHQIVDGIMPMHRVPGTTFDEVMYADDTICISTDTKAMNRFIAEIESKGAAYGLKLNRKKCELIHTGHTARVHFADGTLLKRQTEAKYLGCILNQDSDVGKELNARIGTCMQILKKLDLFWRHSDCPLAFKVQAMDAVIRSKLLYGLDSAQLNEPQLKRLDVFHLKGLRKVLHMNTTYVNRENSNQEVYRRANQILQQERAKKPITPFRQAYLASKTQRFIRTAQSEDSCPVREATFQPGSIKPVSHPNKRVGRPKNKWVTENLKHIWSNIMRRPGALDLKNEGHEAQLKQHIENSTNQSHTRAARPLIGDGSARNPGHARLRMGANQWTDVDRQNAGNMNNPSTRPNNIAAPGTDPSSRRPEEWFQRYSI